MNRMTFCLMVLSFFEISCLHKIPDSKSSVHVPLFSAYHLESQAEIRFKKELAHLIAAQKGELCYYLQNQSYFLEHTVPFYHVYPAPFCGTKDVLAQRNAVLLSQAGYPDSEIKYFPSQINIKNFLDNGNNLIVGCSNPTSDFIPHVRYFAVTHGIDADNLYINNETIDPDKNKMTEDKALLFTKFSESMYASTQEIKQYYQVQTNRKTILFLPTTGDFELTDMMAPLEVRGKILNQLIKLKEKYNVIVRPHPMTVITLMDFYQKNFIIAPQGRFPSFVPLYDVADVIIATPAGGGSVATSRFETPLIILRPRMLWNSTISADEVSQRNHRFTLNETNVVMQKDNEIDLEKRIQEALYDPDTKKKQEGRKEYFRLWFGCIDGYEEYRVFMKKFLPILGVDPANLVEIYKTFPEYKGRKLCLEEL